MAVIPYCECGISACLRRYMVDMRGMNTEIDFFFVMLSSWLVCKVVEFCKVVSLDCDFHNTPDTCSWYRGPTSIQIKIGLQDKAFGTKI
jgi:hypothetical protein